MTEPSSRAELVAELRAFTEGAWTISAIDDGERDLLNRAISALTAPLSADRKAVARVIDPKAWAKVDRLKGTHNWQDWPKMKAKWCSPSLAKADAILALTAPRGAGELQEPCDLEGWRPIWSAPKDGTELAGWIVHRGCDYSPEPFERFSVIAWNFGNTTPGFERTPGWEAKWIGDVTHWRPLPPPPSDDPKPVLPANAKGLKP